MAILIIVIAGFMLVVFSLGLAQWVDGAESIDKEEAEKVRRQDPRLIFSSGGFSMLDEVEADYSHIRI